MNLRIQPRRLPKWPIAASDYVRFPTARKRFRRVPPPRNSDVTPVHVSCRYEKLRACGKPALRARPRSDIARAKMRAREKDNKTLHIASARSSRRSLRAQHTKAAVPSRESTTQPV